MTKSRMLSAIGAAAVVVCTACDRPTAPAATANQTQQAANEVALTIAMGLSDGDLRRDVVGAMRASPFVDHKLDLKAFANTDAGQRLLAAGALARGVQIESVRELIAQLPPMDFYVPFRNDRRSWKGSFNVLVGASLRNETIPDVVYSLGGRSRTFDRRGGDVLMLLEAAEPKDLRILPQSAAAGDVIQDADDGEEGGAIILYDRDGNVTSTTQLAHIFQRIPRRPTAFICDENAVICDDPQDESGSAPRDTSFVTGFWNNGSDGGWSLEFEWRAQFYNASGSPVNSGRLRKTGLHAFYWYTGWHDIVIHNRPRNYTAERIVVRLVETDMFEDDVCGDESLEWDDANKWWDIWGEGDHCIVSYTWTPKP